MEKTQTTTDVMGNVQITNQETLIRPFIGLSARIDLSLRLGQ